jgi:DNA-binding NarL/FixJ family response regulator
VTIRVLLCDDSALLRAALRLLLETDPDIEVVGEAADARAAVALAHTERPDVALMDVRMPGDGVEATRTIVRSAPGVRVVILTSYHDDSQVVAGLRAGAAGFLLKDSTPARLLDAIRAAAAGQTALDPAVARALVEQHVLARPEEAPQSLSEREREILAHVGRGASNAEIARALFLAESTVKSYVSRLFTTLGVRDRAQAIVLAHRHGLVDPGAPERRP